MKKIIIIILIFTIISISITGVLIYLKNDNVESSENINSFDKENNKENGEIISTNDEKTIDLYGTFDENDIEIEVLEKKYDGLERILKIPQIKGLKNKEVEEKVNKDIEKRIDEKIEEIKEKGGQDINNITYKYGGGKYGKSRNEYIGFSNVISFYYSIPYTFEKKETYTDSEIEEENIYFNYELVNGERLKFEDLFTKNTDVISIVRRAFYRSMAKDTRNFGETFRGLFFDKEKNLWIEEIYDWDSNSNEAYKYQEFVPYINENDINKKIKDFINNSKECFYFTPSTLYIGKENDYIDFIDIANEVVIYDKYLTKESLYENNNIGKKQLWTCSQVYEEYHDSAYDEYKFAEDNLFYEINIPKLRIPDNNYPFENSMNKIKEMTLELSKSKIEEYKKIAKENKDKFYIVYLKSSINYNTTDKEEFAYLISANMSEIIVPVDISYKKDIIDKLLEFYRYYNLSFYDDSGLGYGIESLIYVEKDKINDVSRKNELIVYDARTLKEVTSLDEIFVDGYDYKSFLRNCLSSEIKEIKENISLEELNEYLNSANFYFDEYGINAKVKGFDNSIDVIYFSEIDKSLLKIYDLDVVYIYIIPESNTRKIEKSEIEDLTLDELNKAYNEIFARHGHDFKNAELKEYFNSMSWYSAVPNKTVDLNELNETEKYNLDIIKSVINEKK